MRTHLSAADKGIFPKLGWKRATGREWGATCSPTKQNGLFVHIKCLDLSWRDAAVWSHGSGMVQLCLHQWYRPSFPLQTPRRVLTSIKCIMIPQAPSCWKKKKKSISIRRQTIPLNLAVRGTDEIYESPRPQPASSPVTAWVSVTWAQVCLRLQLNYFWQ